MILSYKSQKREISWQSKERIQTLRETIEKVRKGESIDIRAALGTGNPEMEKRWEDGMYPFHFLILYPANAVQTVLREIEEEDSKWQEKAESPSVDEKATKR